MNFKQYLRESEGKTLIDKINRVITELNYVVKSINDTDTNVQGPTKQGISNALFHLKQVEELVNKKPLKTSNRDPLDVLKENIHSMLEENDIEITEGIGQMIMDKLKALKGKKPEVAKDDKDNVSNDERISNAIKGIKDAAKANNDKLLSDKISEFIMIMKYQLSGPAYI